MTNIVPTTNTQIAATNWQSALQEANQTVLKSHPYTALITRTTPTAFVFLIDQSGSMQETIAFGNTACTKAEAVARVVNNALNELINRCLKGTEVRHYYDVALIGYGENAGLLWEGPLTDRTFVSPAELYQHPNGTTDVEVESVVRGKTIKRTSKRPFWLKPVADGLTPMKQAFELAETLLGQWLIDHKGLDCYPPSVINITDGAATDATEGELLTITRRIRQLHTIDGHVLLLNVHLSEVAGAPTLFPCRADQLPDDPYARLLYDLSSAMPARYHADIASLRREDIRPNYVGMSFNADVNALVNFLNIGTPTTVNSSFGDSMRQEP